MRAVTQLTGISEYLLRAWERRYRIVSPRRTPGGTRCYSDVEVARLRLVKRALDAGNKVGEIARMSNDDILRLIEVPEPSPPAIEALVDIMRDGDPAAMVLELEKLFDWLGPVRWVLEIASPLSADIGSRWQSGELSIGEEHLATACLSRVIGARMFSLSPKPSSRGRRAVFTTPSNETHALGIQLAGLIAAAGGVHVQQLGAETPSKDLAEYALRVNASEIVVAVTCLGRSAVQAYFRGLRRETPARIGIVAGGAATNGIKLPEGVTVIGDFADLVEHIAQRRPTSAQAR